MAYWILQANPERYHLREALADPASIRFWTVAHHRVPILSGDKFALWASGKPGGVQALGYVTGGPEMVPDHDPYWSDPAEGEQLTWRVQVRIDEVLPSPIPRAELAADPVFATSAIIRMPGGGNPFPVTEPQWRVIEARLDSAGADPASPPPRGSGTAAPGGVQGREQLRWTREEVILALDLFVSGGVVNGGRFLGKDHPQVIALS